MKLVAPSILAADLANLQGEIGKVPNADMLHVDVMDGQFVPNLSMGVPIVQALSRVTEIPLDVHLMIQRPKQYIEAFARAGAKSITVHVEADTSENIMEALELMKFHGVGRGLALRPMTKSTAVVPFLEYLDMVLVMTVEPGFGGQSFQTAQLECVEEIKGFCQRYKPTCKVQVDGGITERSGALVAKAGADVLVAGTAVFGAENPAMVIQNMKAIT